MYTVGEESRRLGSVADRGGGWAALPARRNKIAASRRRRGGPATVFFSFPSQTASGLPARPDLSGLERRGEKEVGFLREVEEVVMLVLPSKKNGFPHLVMLHIHFVLAHFLVSVANQCLHGR
ncbi:hypothetical protein EJB05_34702, partial [Eragrostis curvula]